MKGTHPFIFANKDCAGLYVKANMKGCVPFISPPPR